MHHPINGGKVSYNNEHRYHALMQVDTALRTSDELLRTYVRLSRLRERERERETSSYYVASSLMESPM